MEVERDLQKGCELRVSGVSKKMSLGSVLQRYDDSRVEDSCMLFGE